MIQFEVKYNQEVPRRMHTGGVRPGSVYTEVIDKIISGDAENACFACNSDYDATRVTNSLRKIIKNKLLRLIVTKRKENVYLVKEAAVAAAV